MLNQAGGDRQILAKQLGISTHQLSYVTHSGEGEGLLFYGSTILPFVDHFPKNTELYRIMTTKPQELKKPLSAVTGTCGVTTRLWRLKARIRSRWIARNRIGAKNRTIMSHGYTPYYIKRTII